METRPGWKPTLRRAPIFGHLAGEVDSALARLLKHDPALNVCARLVRKNTVAIDVGAYVGKFALAMARSVGTNGYVMAFEPQPQIYQELLSSVRGARVIPFNIAVSDADGSAAFNIPRVGDRAIPQRGSLESHLVDDDSLVFDVRQLRLDQLVSETAEVSLIKIDVEGHESKVVRGAETTIRVHKPHLVVEIEQRHLHNRTLAAVVSEIESYGYIASTIRPSGHDASMSGFDVERDQLAWVTADGELKAGARPETYTNNFLFSPVR